MAMRAGRQRRTRRAIAARPSRCLDRRASRRQDSPTICGMTLALHRSGPGRLEDLMTRYTTGRRAILALCAASALVAGLHGSTPTTKPEDVGLSTDRLARVTELMQRHIDARTFSGAVTLVARNGRIAHFEAQGLMDLESRSRCRRTRSSASCR